MFASNSKSIEYLGWESVWLLIVIAEGALHVCFFFKCYKSSISELGSDDKNA